MPNFKKIPNINLSEIIIKNCPGKSFFKKTLNLKKLDKADYPNIGPIRNISNSKFNNFIKSPNENKWNNMPDIEIKSDIIICGQDNIPTLNLSNIELAYYDPRFNSPDFSLGANFNIHRNYMDRIIAYQSSINTSLNSYRSMIIALFEWLGLSNSETEKLSVNPVTIMTPAYTIIRDNQHTGITNSTVPDTINSFSSSIAAIYYNFSNAILKDLKTIVDSENLITTLTPISVDLLSNLYNDLKNLGELKQTEAAQNIYSDFPLTFVNSAGNTVPGNGAVYLYQEFYFIQLIHSTLASRIVRDFTPNDNPFTLFDFSLQSNIDDFNAKLDLVLPMYISIGVLNSILNTYHTLFNTVKPTIQRDRRAHRVPTPDMNTFTDSNILSNWNYRYSKNSVDRYRPFTGPQHTPPAAQDPYRLPLYPDWNYLHDKSIARYFTEIYNALVNSTN